jgi:hypothetical protein
LSATPRSTQALIRKNPVRKVLIATVLSFALAAVAATSASAAPYSNGFETDTAGWCDLTAQGFFPCDGVDRAAIAREPSGYTNAGGYADGIASAGGNYHARFGRPSNCITSQAGGGPVNRCRGPYTDWSNTDYAWPSGGFTTQVDVYLDTAYAAAHPDCYSCNDSRFDWTSEISDPSGDFVRDFVFNFGTDLSGQSQWIVSASQNAGRDSTFPENPGKEPQAITQSGWYTLKHHFFSVYDPGLGYDILAVDMSVIQKSSGNTVASWQLPNRSSATRGDAMDPISSVGCAVLGNFYNQEIADLPIDNARMDGCGAPPTAAIGVTKFYDANANGVKDGSESDITGWKVSISDGPSFSTVTGTTPISQTVPAPGSYTVSEATPTQTSWHRTTASSVPTSVSIGDTKAVSFGNVCTGSGGGLSIGFWTSKNGQALFATPPPGLPLLQGLNLRTADGSDFDPTSYTQFKSWLSKATSTNMAYMLSAQLSSLQLSVAHGKVSPSALVYAPGASSANGAGFATVSALMAEANAQLGAHGLVPSGSPYRTYQSTLKSAVESADLNQSFVQPTPCSFTFP